MKTNFNSSSSRKGFSLVELLLVVSIIGLLSSIAVVHTRGTRERAKITNALSFQAQIHRLLSVDAVGWWNFDNPNNRLQDLSGRHNQGSCGGATCNLTDGVPGTGGQAMSFDGNNFVSAPHTSSLVMTNNLTIGAWIRVSNHRGQRIVQKSPSPNFDYFLSMNSDGRVLMTVMIGGVGRSTPTTVSPLSVGNWYHIVGTYNGSFLRLYLNGIEQGTGIAASGNISNNLGLLNIGQDPNGSDRFYGLIDDVRIYSRGLTASEVRSLYAQTKDNYLAKKK